MERQQFIELVRSQLSRHESDAIQEQSRCGSRATEEEIAEYECD